MVTNIPAVSRWVVPLLALVILINYVDRGNLATAAPLIQDELKLSSTQLGILLSAFFWSYVPAQFLAGWLTERLNPYRALVLGVAVWSAATAATGIATGFGALLALRILLGFGESVGFPCSSKLLAQNLPVSKLGIANGLVLLGLGLGPAFGTFAGGTVMAEYGWRNVFLLFGIASLLWIIPWAMVTSKASLAERRRPRVSAPSYREIARRRESWGVAIGQFCGNYAFYFVITWLPLYLVKARGFSVIAMAEIGGLVYVFYAISTFLTGWLSDRWMRTGASATLVRKTGLIASYVLSAVCLLAAPLGDDRVSIAALLCAGIAFGLSTPHIYAVAQTLAGPSGAAKWIAFQNFISNLSGIVAPVITGMLVDRTGQFLWAFVAAAVALAAGVASWVFLIRKIAPIDWAER